MSQANREIENWNIEIFGEKWDDTCITAVITRWEEDSKKEKHVGGGNIRWLEHDDNNLLFQYSDGCFVATVDNQKELLERLKNWNTGYGYQIKSTIY